MHRPHRSASRQQHVPRFPPGLAAQVQPAALQELHCCWNLRRPWHLPAGWDLHLLWRLLRNLLPGPLNAKPRVAKLHLTRPL